MMKSIVPCICKTTELKIRIEYPISKYKYPMTKLSDQQYNQFKFNEIQNKQQN